MTEDSEGLVTVLEDIRRWVKIIGIQEAKPLLKDALSAENGETRLHKRQVYHLTDGNHSTRDIPDIVEPSRSTVMRWQSQWAAMGLLEKNGGNAPYNHVISLEEAGLETPELPESNAEND